MPQKLIPVIRGDETTKILATCRGRQFAQLRDEAIIRLYCDTGARLSEVGTLLLDDVDMNTESVHFHGKGSKDRRVRFGPRTARAVSRYLRARAKHKAAHLPDLWPAERGIRPLAPTALRSCSSAGALRLDWSSCTRIGGGTPSPMSGSVPAATPAT
ncbi:tyrosine-type recombinase/integrase [Streptomyces prunicolor]